MIRLLLVDNQILFSQGLQAMLNLEPDLEVVGIASNARAALKQVKTLKPDIVLIDITMTVMDGLEAIRIICQSPDTKVLVLSTFDEDDYIAQSLKAGAKGYLLKDMPCEELAKVIRLVERGYCPIGPGLMERMLDRISNSCITKTEPVKPAPAELSSRELQVLELIGTGCTNREIAQQLYITEGTVKTHVTHILNLLNLRNRVQIAIYACSARQNCCHASGSYNN